MVVSIFAVCGGGVGFTVGGGGVVVSSTFAAVWTGAGVVSS